MPVSAWSQPIVTIDPWPWDFILRPTAAAEADRGHDVDRPEQVELGVEGELRIRAGERVGAGDVQPGVEAAPERPGLLDEAVARVAIGQVGHQDLGRGHLFDRSSRASSSAARIERRPCTMTSAPASARARATARPIPDVAPRTAARRPRRSNWGLTDRHGGAEK